MVSCNPEPLLKSGFPQTWTNAVRKPPAAPMASALTLRAPTDVAAHLATGRRWITQGPAQVKGAPGQASSGGLRSRWIEGLWVELRNLSWVVGCPGSVWAGPRPEGLGDPTALFPSYTRRERVSGGRLLLPPRRVPQHRRLLCLHLCPWLPARTPWSLLSWSVDPKARPGLGKRELMPGLKRQRREK